MLFTISVCFSGLWTREQWKDYSCLTCNCRNPGGAWISYS